MQEKLQEIHECFMELGILLSGIDLEEDLNNKLMIDKIEFALKQTYKLYAEGLCEIEYVCEKCESNKNQLFKLLKMFKSCCEHKKIDPVSSVALVEFAYIIPQVLSELKSTYIQNLKVQR
ncbi:MAG: hypothetical protein COA44_03365 [Arcobacter sp.]|nr:MAG: hypothetical protein COA44_03365 [Arcobacter sp.]